MATATFTISELSNNKETLISYFSLTEDNQNDYNKFSSALRTEVVRALKDIPELKESDIRFVNKLNPVFTQNCIFFCEIRNVVYCIQHIIPIKINNG